jgi:hypothetical protein
MKPRVVEIAAAAVQRDKTIKDPAPPDPWKEGARIQIVSGVSVLEAKKIVRTLDDPFDGERGQMVRIPSRGTVERYRAEQEKMTRTMRAPPRPARATRAPPKDPCAFERTLTLIFLLTVLGLQLALLVRIDRFPG